MATPIDFDSLVRSVRPQLVRYTGRLVGEADAEDVVQLVLSKAASALAGFRGEASPRTWLFRIATNAALDFNRARRGLGGAPLELESVEEACAATSEAAPQERQLVREQMSHCVREVLGRLPEKDQVALALSDIEELSDREVATVLGVTLGAAKIRLHRARARLKEELEGACSFYYDAENTLFCDRKEKSTKGEYPSDGESRRTNASRTTGGDSESLNEDQTMNAVTTLPVKQRHLIGVGAAIAAGCESCTASYVAAAKAEGACARGVQFAIEHGLKGRQDAATALSSFAAETFGEPILDAEFRAERALLGALIEVAAAIATNAASSVASRIDAARALGATDPQLRLAVRLAQTAKNGAENAVSAALNAALGEASGPAPSPCCADRAVDGAAERCDCGSQT